MKGTLAHAYDVATAMVAPAEDVPVACTSDESGATRHFLPQLLPRTLRMILRPFPEIDTVAFCVTPLLNWPR